MKNLRDLLKLKDIVRSGWVRAGIDSPESVAAHSWGMACLASCLCPPDLDFKRVLLMCIAHDIPEINVGDITPHDNMSKDEKYRLEDEAAQQLLAQHPLLMEAYKEYRDERTEESLFVHRIDKLDMALQAQNYADCADTEEFIDSAICILPKEWRNLLL